MNSTANPKYRHPALRKLVFFSADIMLGVPTTRYIQRKIIEDFGTLFATSEIAPHLERWFREKKPFVSRKLLKREQVK